MKNVFEMTVRSGEDIREAIARFVLEKGWSSVMIPCAIGSVIDMVFTTPVENTLPLRTAKTPVSSAAELLSFTGEVMKKERMDPALAAVYKDDGPLFVHIHASCATAGGHVAGGGLAGGKAFRAVRVFLVPLEEEQ